MIVGSAYSGSTLLTALLDRHRDVSTIGEAASLYDPQAVTRDPLCWRCGVRSSECLEWQQWDRKQPLHAFALATNPGRVVIDSSKDPAKMIEQWHRAGTYPASIKAIHLSKTPLEQIGSYHKHQQWRIPVRQVAPWTAVECVDQWILTNYWYAGYLLQSSVDTLRITYAELTKENDATLAKVAAFLGLDTEWAEPTSHTLGGNPAVVSIASGNEKGFGNAGRADYLGGKYAHKSDGLQVTYDESWKEMPEEFAAEAAEAMRKQLREVSPLMQLLGHMPPQESI
jgi:hypothetical protein